MKKFFLLIALSLVALAGFSQDFTSLDNYEFSSKADYKDKEPKVKECVSNILSKPYDEKDRNRLIAAQFIINWMTGTPDYTFSLGKGFAAISDKKEVAYGVLFMAGMIDYVFANPDKKDDHEAVEKAGVIAVLNYCDNAANKLQASKKIKKLIEANKNGKLDDELGL